MKLNSHSFVECAQDFELPNKTQVRLLIHGGAWDIPPALQQGHRQGLQKAYDAAQSSLKASQEPWQSVLAALDILEDDPVFDAGFGSFLNEHGKVELDAAVMEGANLHAGAVACLDSFAHPARVAHSLMQSEQHVLLVGGGASDFAIQQGFVALNDDALVLPREKRAHELWQNAGRPDARLFFAEGGSASLNAKIGENINGSEPHKRGTVGVILGLKKINSDLFTLFAGTSTGGIPGKKRGRVGDTPLVGAGIYADDEGAAVLCTGWGEAFIRMGVAKSVSEKVANGMHPQEAAEHALHTLLRRTGGRGGIIALDAQGRSGAAFSTPDMAFAGNSVKCIL